MNREQFRIIYPYRSKSNAKESMFESAKKRYRGISTDEHLDYNDSKTKYKWHVVDGKIKSFESIID